MNHKDTQTQKIEDRGWRIEDSEAVFDLRSSILHPRSSILCLLCVSVSLWFLPSSAAEPKPGDPPAGPLSPKEELATRELPGPWMYTGGLENWRTLVHLIARQQPLWGNGFRALLRVRSPWTVARVLDAAHVPHPAVYARPSEVPRLGRWLVKPIAGAGGAGIRLWTGQRLTTARKRRRVYFQEYIAGDACSAVYLGDGVGSRLLGMTRQLVGEDWLHARPFRYCGSVGPLVPESRLGQALEQLGTALAGGCGLRGLFGVDCVVRDGVPWPVEVNPRYTASVEVLEYATGLAALSLHRRGFDPAAPEHPLAPTAAPRHLVGKAILFARVALTFPDDGPWLPVLRSPGPLSDMPAFADIPSVGERIEAGRPILTFFARADSQAACLDTLRQIASDLDRWLFSR